MQKILLLWVFSFLFEAASLAKNLETQNSKAPSKDLPQIAELVVEVNGISNVYTGKDPIVIVKGDKLKLLSAKTTSGAEAIELINLVGFANSKRAGDDRQIEIDTERDLLDRFAMGASKDLYRIVAMNKGQPVGESLLKVLEPKLSHAVLTLNGNRSVWREGEMIRVKASDKVKVEKVVTNLGEKSKDVLFKIVPLKVSGAEDFGGFKLYEIRFQKGQKVFAKIPMQVDASR